MKRLLLGLSCVFLSCAALAAAPDVVRKRAQASMLVTGSVIVTPEGNVRSFVIDQTDKLPPVVVDLLGKSVPTWTFQPVLLDGKPVAAKAKMSVRIVAKPVDDQHDSIGIVGAQFGQDDDVQGESISYKTRPSPKYPDLSLQSHVSGTVYLLLRVGRQGKVEAAVAEQVNLAVYASDRDMNRFRNDLADAALDAAKRWTFNTPTTGKHVADAYWVARVPVVFGDLSHEVYGKWEGYIPGPHELVPWLEKGNMISGNIDAAPDGGIYQVDQGLHLTTPLDGA